MSDPQIPHRDSVPAEDYTREYYETCCEGYEEYTTTKGESLPFRLSIPLKLGNVHAGMNVVDIGCGRGEIVIHCARLGAKTWGLDYADEALRLAHKIMTNDNNQPYIEIMAVQKSRSTQLPFANESVDLVFMLDIVEHLYPDELKLTFDEVWRILHPKGFLIIHTMPNLDYYQYGYPIYRFFQSLRKIKLPTNPRERWAYSSVHVNEQTPRKLREELVGSRFYPKVWLYSTQTYRYEHNPVVRFGMNFLTHFYPFRLIFCNDIFSIGQKRCV